MKKVETEKSVLELGCGSRKVDDSKAFTVDLRKLNSPDLVHDLEDTPWPLPDNQFEEVYLRHVLEHITNWQSVMKELHRVCKSGAIVHIWSPHPSVSIFSPDHKTHFTPGSLAKHVDPSHHEYIGVEFELIHRELHWRHYSRRNSGIGGTIGKLVDAVANRFYGVFNQYLWAYFGGFEEFYMKLQVKK